MLQSNKADVIRVAKINIVYEVAVAYFFWSHWYLVIEIIEQVYMCC